MSNFLGWFFHVLGVKKNLNKIFKNILATALKSYIKWLLYIYFFFFAEKVWKSWKNWNYLHKIFVTMYSICYTRIAANLAASANRSCWSLIFSAINSSLASFLLSIFFCFFVFLSKTKTKWSTYQSDIRVDMVGTIHDDLHTMTVYTIGSIPHKYFFDTIMAIAQNIMKYFFWVSFFWKLT